MERKAWKRYLILITALMIFAGAAWYFTQDSGAPQAGAVLADLEERMPDRWSWMDARRAEVVSADQEEQLSGSRLCRYSGEAEVKSADLEQEFPFWEEASHEL